MTETDTRLLRIRQVRGLTAETTEATCEHCGCVRPLEALELTSRERLICIDREPCRLIADEQRRYWLDTAYREQVEKSGERELVPIRHIPA